VRTLRSYRTHFDIRDGVVIRPRYSTGSRSAPRPARWRRPDCKRADGVKASSIDPVRGQP